MRGKVGCRIFTGMRGARRRESAILRLARRPLGLVIFVHVKPMQPLQLDSVTRKMLLPLVLASAAMLLGVLAILMHVQGQTVDAAGIATAKAVASQIVNLRKFYTAEIAARATPS